MRVELTKEQEQLKKIIEAKLAITKDWKNQNSLTVQKAFSAMKEAAHQLHMQLDPKPRHHRYMIENRGLNPEDPEFYDHIHPVEDLLAYLKDTSANDDPEDITIGCKFHFNLYSSRWGYKDHYELTRTKKGWHINFMSYIGEDDINHEMKNLYSAMEHDSISYPRDVDSYLRSIWIEAREQGLTKEEVQQMLNKVADWISETEMNAPRDILSK